MEVVTQFKNRVEPNNEPLKWDVEIKRLSRSRIGGRRSTSPGSGI